MIILKIAGVAMFALAGIYMWIVETIWFWVWWGGIGVLISIFVPPLFVAFPLVFWFSTGMFPTFYILVWVVGLAGLLLYGFTDKTTG